MKKFLSMLLLLTLIIVGGLGFFIVRSFNADAFQQQVVQGLSDLTGRDFNVAGDTQVSWFPAPQIVLNDVSLSNVPNSMYRSMLEAKQIIVQFELMSLLKEPLVINRIEIDEPKIYMERLNATETNWSFPFLFADVNDNLDRDLMASDIKQTRVDMLTIKNGTLEYDNRMNKTEWIIQKINGNISLDSLQGPYSFDGTFNALGKTVKAQARLDRLHADSPVNFQLNLSGEDGNFSLDDVTGTVLMGVKGKARLTADGSFNVTRPNDLLKLFNLKPLDATLNIPSMGSFGYESNQGKEIIKNFIMRFGNQEDAVALSGSVTREEQDKKLLYTASLAINKLDYGQWAEFLSDLKWAQTTDEKLPNFSLKLNIKDLLWQKEKIQNVSADFIKKNNRFQVENGKALLKGNTAVTFSGGTLTQDNQTGLNLLIAASTDQVKELLNGYVETGQVDASLLKNMKFTGQVVLYPEHFTTHIQSLTVDKGEISGELSYKKGKKLPNITAKLNIDSFDLDAYTGYQLPKEATDVTQFVTLIKNYLQQAFFLKTFNGELDIGLKNVRFQGMPIGQGVLKGSVEDNVLKVTAFETQEMANASMSGSGEFSGVGTENVGISNMKIDFKTNDLGLFLGKAHLKTDNAFLKTLKAFEMNLDLSEAENVWNTALQLKAGELETSLSGKINTTESEPVYQDMNVFVSYPSFRQFVKNIAGLTEVNTSLNGFMKANAIINGTVNQFSFTNGVLQIGQNQLNAEGSYHRENNDFWDITVSAPSFDVNKYIWNDLKNISLTGLDSQKAFQLSKLDSLNQHITVKTAQLLYHNFEIKNALLEATLNNQTLTLKNLTGVIGDESAPLSVNGSLNWQKEPELDIDFKIEKMPLNHNVLTPKNMSVGEGTLSTNGHLSAKGKSPSDMMSHLNGKGYFDWQNLVWVGTNIEKVEPLVDRAVQNRVPQATFDKAVLRLLTSGKTQISSVAGHFTIDNGRFQAMDTALKGTGFLSDPMQVVWNIPLKDLDISIPLSLTGRPDYPPFALSLKGKLMQLAYQTNFVDLSASVADIVQQGNEQIQQKEKVAREEQAAQARNEREEKAQKAILEAREAVQNAALKVKTGDNSRALQLLQSAQDALEFMNNLSIKESLTDAEYIQLTEQSRLAVLKAEEAVAEATNDKFFEDRKFIRALEKQSTAMQREIERIGVDYPDIEIVQKLVPLTAKYAKTLSDISASLPVPNETDEEHFSHMARVKVAYLKVLKGYQYVLRFDPSAVPMTPLLESNEGETADSEETQTEPPSLTEESEEKTEEVESPAKEVPSEVLSEEIRARISGHISKGSIQEKAENKSEHKSEDKSEDVSDKMNDQGMEELGAFTGGTGIRGSIQRSD